MRLYIYLKTHKKGILKTSFDENFIVFVKNLKSEFSEHGPKYLILFNKLGVGGKVLQTVLLVNVYANRMISCLNGYS